MNITRTHRLTLAQKKCVDFMRSHGGECVIITGYKSVITRDYHPAIGCAVIGLSANVLDGLMRRRLVTVAGPRIYRLTESKSPPDAGGTKEGS